MPTLVAIGALIHKEVLAPGDLLQIELAIRQGPHLPPTARSGHFYDAFMIEELPIEKPKPCQMAPSRRWR